MGFYHIPLPAEYFSAFSSCLGCYFGVAFLYVEVCGSSLLWRVLPDCGVGRVAVHGFLIREASLGVLVGGAGSLLSEMQ